MDNTAPAEPVSHLAAAEAMFASEEAPSKPAAPAATPQATPQAAPAQNLIKTKAAAPAAPAAAPAPVAPDFDKIPGPDEKSKHRADWDKMKGTATEHFNARTAAETKLAALEAQLAARGPAQADEATKARIAQLEGQVKGYDEKLKVYDLQSHPEFQKQFIEPQTNAVKGIKAALELEGVTSANVDQILTLEGKSFVEAVSKLLPELSEFNRATVAQAFRDAKAAGTAAKAALGNVDELRSKYSADFAARSKAAFDAVGKQFDDTLGQVVSDEKADEATKAGDMEYNSHLAALSKRAEALAFGQTSETSVSEMAHKATRFDFMINQAVPRLVANYDRVVGEQSAKIAALTQQVNELTGAQPRVSGGSGEGQSSPRQTESNHLKAAEAYLRS